MSTPNQTRNLSKRKLSLNNDANEGGSGTQASTAKQCDPPSPAAKAETPSTKRRRRTRDQMWHDYIQQSLRPSHQRPMVRNSFTEDIRSIDDKANSMKRDYTDAFLTLCDQELEQERVRHQSTAKQLGDAEIKVGDLLEQLEFAKHQADTQKVAMTDAKSEWDAQKHAARVELSEEKARHCSTSTNLEVTETYLREWREKLALVERQKVDLEACLSTARKQTESMTSDLDLARNKISDLERNFRARKSEHETSLSRLQQHLMDKMKECHEALGVTKRQEEQIHKSNTELIEFKNFVNAKTTMFAKLQKDYKNTETLRLEISEARSHYDIIKQQFYAEATAIQGHIRTSMNNTREIEVQHKIMNSEMQSCFTKIAPLLNGKVVEDIKRPLLSANDKLSKIIGNAGTPSTQINAVLVRLLSDLSKRTTDAPRTAGLPPDDGDTHLYRVTSGVKSSDPRTRRSVAPTTASISPQPTADRRPALQDKKAQGCQERPLNNRHDATPHAPNPDDVSRTKTYEGANRPVYDSWRPDHRSPEYAQTTSKDRDGKSVDHIHDDHPRPPDRVISAIASRKYCNQHHLRGECNRHECKYTHGERVTGDDRRALRILEASL